MDDYELVELIHQRNDEAFELLLKKYHYVILKAIGRVKARANYTCSSSDEDDEILQKCHLAMLDAVYNFRDDGGASFSHYAFTCVESAIRSHIRQQRTMKSQTTNLALSLDTVVKDSDEIYIVDTLENNHPEFEGIFCLRFNQYDWIETHLRNELTEEELKILKYRLMGYTYREISLVFDCKLKHVAYICDKIKKLLVSHID